MRNLERYRSWTVVAFALWATSSSAEDRPSGLPFRLYQEHLIVVKGSIGGLDGLAFLIDTGTSRTLVDKKIANKLRLVSQGEVELESFKNGEAREAIVPELSFGPIRIQSARLLTADLSVLSWSRTGIDAVVGLDVLTLGSFSVDYASRRITFGPVAESRFAVPLRATPPLLTVDLAIGNRIARLMVDTGAPRLTLFPNRMQLRLPGF